MADDDDLPPPLEDMSEIMQKLNAFKTQQGSTKSSSAVKSPQQHGKTVKEKKPMVSSMQAQVPSESPKMSKHQVQEKEEKNEDASAKTSASTTTTKTGSQFGGMSKGFLFGGGGSTKAVKKPSSDSPKSTHNLKASNNDDMPFIKPKHSKEKSFEFAEVQSAMKSTEVLLQNKDWVTEDLLKDVQDDPVLAGAFESPQFAKAAAEMQQNPQAAMEKYKDNPEMQTFLQKFCKLLGTHFSKLGDQQASSSAGGAGDVGIQEVATSAGPQASAEDLTQIQDIVSRPDVKEALMDPAITKLIETLRQSPDEGQRMLQQMSSDQRAKVQVLVQNGLLGTQRT